MEENVQKNISIIKEIIKLCESTYYLQISLNEYKTIEYIRKNFEPIKSLSNQNIIYNSLNKLNLKITPNNKKTSIKYFCILYYLFYIEIRKAKKSQLVLELQYYKSIIKSIGFILLKLFKDFYIETSDYIFLCKFLLYLSMQNYLENEKQNTNIKCKTFFELSITLIDELYKLSNNDKVIMSIKYLNNFCISFNNLIKKGSNLYQLQSKKKFSQKIFDFIFLISKYKASPMYGETYYNYLEAIKSFYIGKFNYKNVMLNFLNQMKSIISNIDTKLPKEIEADTIIANFSIDYLNGLYDIESKEIEKDTYKLQNGFYMSEGHGGLSSKIPSDLKDEFTFIFSFKLKPIENMGSEMYQILNILNENIPLLSISVIKERTNQYGFDIFTSSAFDYSAYNTSGMDANQKRKSVNASILYNNNMNIRIEPDKTFIFLITFTKGNVEIFYFYQNNKPKKSDLLNIKISKSLNNINKGSDIFYGCDSNLINRFNGYLGPLIVLKGKPTRDFIEHLFNLGSLYEFIILFQSFDLSVYGKFYYDISDTFFKAFQYFTKDRFIRELVMVISTFSFTNHEKDLSQFYNKDNDNYVISNKFLNPKNYSGNFGEYNLILKNNFDNSFHIFQNQFTLIEFIKIDGINFISFQFEYYFQILSRISALLGIKDDQGQFLIFCQDDNKKEDNVEKYENSEDDLYKIKSELTETDKNSIKRIIDICLKNLYNLVLTVKNILREINIEEFDFDLRKLFYQMKYAISKLFEFSEIYKISIESIFIELNKILLILIRRTKDFSMVATSNTSSSRSIILNKSSTKCLNILKDLRNIFLDLILNIRANPTDNEFKVVDKLLYLIESTNTWDPPLSGINMKNLLEKFSKLTNILKYGEEKEELIIKFIKLVADTLNNNADLKDKFFNFDGYFNSYPSFYYQFLKKLYLFGFFKHIDESHENILIFLIVRYKNYPLEVKMDKKLKEEFHFLFLLILIDVHVNPHSTSKINNLHNIIKDSPLSLNLFKALLSYCSNLNSENKFNFIMKNEHCYDEIVNGINIKDREKIEKINKKIELKASLFEDMVYLLTKNASKINELYDNQEKEENEENEENIKLLKEYDTCYKLLYKTINSICRNIETACLNKIGMLSPKILSHKKKICSSLFFFRYQTKINSVKEEMMSLSDLSIRCKKNSFIFDFFLLIAKENDNLEQTKDIIIYLLQSVLKLSIFHLSRVNNNKKILNNISNLINVMFPLIFNKTSIFQDSSLVTDIINTLQLSKLFYSKVLFSPYFITNNYRNLINKTCLENLFDLLLFAYIKTNIFDYLELLINNFIIVLNKSNNNYEYKHSILQINFNLISISKNKGLSKEDTFKYVRFITFFFDTKNIDKYEDYDIKLVKDIVKCFKDKSNNKKMKINYTVYFLIKILLYYTYAETKEDKEVQKYLYYFINLILINLSYMKHKYKKFFRDSPIKNQNHLYNFTIKEFTSQYLVNYNAESYIKTLSKYIRDLIPADKLTINFLYYFNKQLLINEEFNTDIRFRPYEYEKVIQKALSLNSNCPKIFLTRSLSQFQSQLNQNQEDFKKDADTVSIDSNEPNNTSDSLEKLDYKSISEQPYDNSKLENYKSLMNSDSLNIAYNQNELYIRRLKSFHVSKNDLIGESSSNKYSNNSSSNNSENVQSANKKSIKATRKNSTTLFTKKEVIDYVLENHEIKLQKEDFRPYIIICGRNQIFGKRNESFIDEVPMMVYNKNSIVLPKKEFMLTSFSNAFKDVLFSNELFKKMKLKYYYYYYLSLKKKVILNDDVFIDNDKISNKFRSSSKNDNENHNYNKISLGNKVLNYPSKIKNYSNFLEPPLFLKQDSSFFESEKFFKVSHNYFLNYIDKSKLVKFKFYKKFPEYFVYDKNCMFYTELISTSNILLGKIYITNNGYLFFQSVDKKKCNLCKDYNTVYVFSDPSTECKFKEKIIYINYSEIKEIIIRRYLLMWQAIEVYLSNGKSYFFNLFRNHFVENFIAKIKPHLISPKTYDIKEFFKEEGYIKKWNNGKLSTYEFLLLINKYSARTYNDPNQYPVFPWLLRDYKELSKIQHNSFSFSNLNNTLSNKDLRRSALINKTYSSMSLSNLTNLNINKITSNYKYRNLNYPITAQTREKRVDLESKYNSCEKFKYHMGSHYSTSSYIYYYLMRQYPFTKLLIQLQSYHQEDPDRMFFNINETLNIIFEGNDNRELIPEFFSKIEFLINLNCVEFGVRSDGKIIDDFEFSHEEIGDYAFFIFKHREILNNDDIKEKICPWINYTFGKNQLNNSSSSCTTFMKSTYEEKYKLEKKLEHLKIIKYNYNELNDKKLIFEIIEGKITLLSSFGCVPYRLFDTEINKKNKQIGEDDEDVEEMDNNMTTTISNINKMINPKDNLYTYPHGSLKSLSKVKVGEFNEQKILFFKFDNMENTIKKDSIYILNEKYELKKYFIQESTNNLKLKENDNILSLNSMSYSISSNEIYKEYSQGVLSSFILINNIKTVSDIIITCRDLSKSINIYYKIKNTKLHKSIFIGEFVNCIANGNNNNNIFYTGLSNGKLLEWQVTLAFTFNDLNCTIIKSVMAHEESICLIYYYERLNLLLTYGNDNYVYIRKSYDFELLSCIKINKNLNVINMKVSDMNFVYLLCFDKTKIDEPFVIYGYTLNGINFCVSNYGYFQNFFFTLNGNLMVSKFSDSHIHYLKCYNLEEEDTKTENNNECGVSYKNCFWFERFRNERETNFIYLGVDNNKLIINNLEDK